jgi:hypothetical protein
MSDHTIDEGTVRARHLFRRYAQLRQISADDLPHYQQQVREVLTQHGADYLEHWLQGWVDEAQADITAAERRRAERAAAMAEHSAEMHAAYLAKVPAGREPAPRHTSHNSAAHASTHSNQTPRPSGRR